MVIMVREEIELVMLIFKVDQKNISYLQYILQIFIISFLAVLKLMVMSNVHVLRKFICTLFTCLYNACLVICN